MDEDKHHKEVYAYFGVAIYLAQVLENGLVNALLFLDFFPKNAGHLADGTSWADKFDAFFDSRIALTMGNLIRELRKVTAVPDTLEEQLRTALERRKFLVHSYFRDNVVLFASEEGRNTLIADLEGYGADFQAAIQSLDALIEPLCMKYGMTPERRTEALEAWKHEAARQSNGAAFKAPQNP